MSIILVSSQIEQEREERLGVLIVELFEVAWHASGNDNDAAGAMVCLSYFEEKGTGQS